MADSVIEKSTTVKQHHDIPSTKTDRLTEFFLHFVFTAVDLFKHIYFVIYNLN